ncbi:MAG TPA: hypothetical protein VM900_01315 [Sphingomonas sp.]|jgi:hypothetical protein|nr:hypothetical protein [Sphingomonas sp.]
MTHIIVFNLLLVAACGYAFVAGGAPERLTAAVFLVAAAATYVAPYRQFREWEIALFAIDVATLVALAAIAARADRFWPLYVSALQLLTLGIHGVKAYQPALVHWMYGGASGKIAYPMLALLAVGVLRHRRRLTQHGSDPDWSLRTDRPAP